MFPRSKYGWMGKRLHSSWFLNGKRKIALFLKCIQKQNKQKKTTNKQKFWSKMWVSTAVGQHYKWHEAKINKNDIFLEESLKKELFQSGKVITDVKFRDVTNIWNEQIMFCKQIEIQMLIGSGVFCLCVCVSFVSGLLQLSVLNTPKKHTHTRNMLLFIKNADLCAVHSTSDLFIFYCFPLFIKWKSSWKLIQTYS